MSIRPFTRELRAQGFELDWRYRCKNPAGCVTQFKKRDGDRELHVQLWGYGSHRVSHGTYNEFGLRETTTPTDFRTVAEMILAIKFEWVRPSGKQ